MNDIDIIYDMSCKNKIFYKYHPPFVTKESIRDDMQALPPQKSYEDKYYVGFFENETLVANMDLILSYPEQKIAYIGLFMMNEEYQNKGIGSNIIEDTRDYLRQLGYRKICLGVDEGNPQSFSFWTKNKFVVIGESEYISMELIL